MRGFARSQMDGVYKIPKSVLEPPPSSSLTVDNYIKKITQPPLLKHKARRLARPSKSALAKAAVLQPARKTRSPTTAAQPQAEAQAAAITSTTALPTPAPAPSADTQYPELIRRQKKLAKITKFVAQRKAAKAAASGH